MSGGAVLLDGDAPGRDGCRRQGRTAEDQEQTVGCRGDGERNARKRGRAAAHVDRAGARERGAAVGIDGTARRVTLDADVLRLTESREAEQNSLELSADRSVGGGSNPDSEPEPGDRDAVERGAAGGVPGARAVREATRPWRGNRGLRQVDGHR